MDGKSILLAVVGEGVYRVPAQGGTPLLIIENEHIEYLSFLPEPNGEELLLYASGVRKDSEIHEVVVHSLTTGVRTVVATVEFPTPEPVYSPTGHVLYRAPGMGLSYLQAMPFSLDSLEVTGDPFVLARGAEDPRVSTDGTLVYLTPRISRHQLVWLDRTGRKLGNVGEPHSLIRPQNWRTESMRFPTLSPDGRLAAVTLISEEGPAIWIQEMDRPVRTRLTPDSEEAIFATWSSSGERLTFSSRGSGQWDILSKLADGSGDTETLVASALDEGDPDWSTDGKYMVFVRIDPVKGRDIWYLRKSGEGVELTRFLQTPFSEGTPKFSHDGRFVVYTSDQSGRPEVYVRPFPAGTGRWQVSIGGGTQPRWGSNDGEIFYVQEDTLISAQVATQSAFSLGPQTRLFRSEGLRSPDAPQYDVAPDGDRFLLIEPAGRNEQRSITVVLNAFATMPGQ